MIKVAAGRADKWSGAFCAAASPLPMATRLLSFLSDIEQALLKESAASMGPIWTATRMVNYHQGLARMTLVPPPATEEPAPHGGTILLQSFLLSDGSLCLKAVLGWEGSTQSALISVYSQPRVDWRAEASGIAARWLAGPAAVASASAAAPAQPDLTALLSATG